MLINNQSTRSPKSGGQLNEKGNGSSPDPFLARLRALRKKGLARETSWPVRYQSGVQIKNKNFQSTQKIIIDAHHYFDFMLSKGVFHCVEPLFTISHFYLVGYSCVI